MNRWVAGARPKTLPAAVVPVMVGTAAVLGADEVGATVVWWRAVAAMVVALAIQVATNYVNDYADAERGADTAERIGPTRLVASGLATPAEVKRAALASALVAGLAGLALAVAVGPELVVVGVASLAAGFFYTAGPRPYGYAGLGEVFVFVFFGVVATVGSAYVHLDRVDPLAFAASVPVGMLATALLVVNNLRDIPTDAAAGKRTLAVRLGAPPTRAVYVALVAGAFVMLPVLALSRPWVLLAALAAPLALRPLRAVASEAAGARLLPALADTGRLQLGYGFLLAAGLTISP
ncbi:MAG: 1,4-dihydroxy-2-naphthoate polyprenyltransferase [Actinobacteria bacterium]|nr:1,4-dihydroxy-2-naphthoate polyprenyltransferase [Actinomycetota bacterium]